MTRNYDLVVVLDPEISKEEQETLLQKIRNLITDFKGKKPEEKNWGKKDLAYPIKKRNSGIYFEFSFVLPAEAAPELRKKLLSEERILRYLLIRNEK